MKKTLIAVLLVLICSACATTPPTPTAAAKTGEAPRAVVATPIAATVQRHEFSQDRVVCYTWKDSVSCVYTR